MTAAATSRRKSADEGLTRFTRHRTRAGATHMTIEEVTPLARSLAEKRAHRPADVDDLVQVALFAYHRDTERVGVVVMKPYAHARTVLERAMWSYYHNVARRTFDGFLRMPDAASAGHNRFECMLQNDMKVPQLVDMTMPAAIIDGRMDLEATDRPDDMEFDDYFTALERAQRGEVQARRAATRRGEVAQGAPLPAARGEERDQVVAPRRARGARRRAAHVGLRDGARAGVHPRVVRADARVSAPAHTDRTRPATCRTGQFVEAV
jgi:hypothetical protein